MHYHPSIKSILRGFGASALIAFAMTAGTAQAALVSVSDWHLTTDGFSGLKQSHISDDIYFAVSRSNVWNPEDVYEMLPGFRWATSAEYYEIVHKLATVPLSTYHNQGGWEGYVWEGIKRDTFKYADSAATGIAKHAGNYDNAFRNYYQRNGGNNNHAGFVLLRNNVPVAEPASLALVALGLAMLGFNRKRIKTTL